jgi:hypothetical protein
MNNIKEFILNLIEILKGNSILDDYNLSSLSNLVSLIFSELNHNNIIYILKVLGNHKEENYHTNFIKIL